MLIIGVTSGMVPALQPLLLGQLAAEGRISLAEIGQAAMLEALGMALAASIAGAMLPPRRLRAIAVGAVLTGLSVNVATPQLSGLSLAMLRGLGGISAGMLLWLWIGLLTRAALPARLIAIAVTLQASFQLALSSLFASYLLPWGGSIAHWHSSMAACSCSPP
jgi:MFS transporter, DHA1 family, inner membrane transport protein